MSIQCEELANMLRKRLRKANLPVVVAMTQWKREEVAQFDAIQEVIMQTVYDFAIKQARRELKRLTERTEP